MSKTNTTRTYAAFLLLAALGLLGCEQKPTEPAPSPTALAPGMPPPNISNLPPGRVPDNAPPEVKARAGQGGPPPR